jgi:iron complex transport system ATP-binding protein
VSGPLAEFRDVAFSYPRPERSRQRCFGFTALSFTVERGEIFGVVGPNSAGKTSLLRLLSRVLAPTAGEIMLDGRSVARLTGPELARRLAVVPQEAPRPFPFTVAELALMGRYPHAPTRFFEDAEDAAIARAAMAETGVLDLAGLPFEELSGGERQRAMLARALAQRTPLLLLDEPTSHLDLRYQAQTAALLRGLNRGRGVTIVLVSHDLNLAAELCDRLLLLADGRAVRTGPPAEVLDESVLEPVFGCRVSVDKSPTSGRPVVQVAWPAERNA